MRILHASRLVILLGLAGSLWAADPFVGTWKLNVAKSIFSLGQTPEKEETVVISEQGDNRVVTDTEIAGDGKPSSRRFMYPAKGGPVTDMEGAPRPGVSELRKRIDDRTMEQVTTRDGKVITTARYLLSKDGNAITVRRTGRNQAGQAFEAVRIYERQ